MSHPPKVFISAASGDLRSVRQVVKDALLSIGCHPVEQTNFPPDYRTVEKMLKDKISDSQALIHIVGLRYGAEPEPLHLPANTPRRSYTQLEYDFARQLSAKHGDQRFRVFTFVCPDDFSFDNEPDVEPTEKRELQQQHRRQILSGETLYETPKDVEALKERVLLIKEEVLQLRAAQSRRERLTLGGIALIVFALLGVGYGVYHYLPHETEKQVKKVFHADPVLLRAKLEEQIETSFKSKLTELKEHSAPPADIDQLYRQRDQTVAKLDETIAFIRATAAETTATLVRKATVILQERGVDAALELLEQAVKEQGQDVKKQARDLAEAVLFKAELQESKLDYTNARKSIEEAINLDYQWWKPHNQLGLLTLYLAQWDLAEKEFKEAERFVEAEQEKAIVMNNLAQLLQATNRLTEAEPLMRYALAIDEKSLGSEHPNVARDLNNLAQLLQATNRLTEAEPLMRRVITIFEKSLGENHPNVATALNNLAELFRTTNRSTEAEPLYRRALAIDEKSFGSEHPNVATALNNLAELFRTTNRLTEAEPLYRRALTIDEQSFGSEHPDVARDLNNLAQLLKATNRLTEAESLMRRVITIFEKSLGDNHPNVATALNNLALLLQATNRLTKAEPLYRRALAIDEKSLGSGHPNVAIDLNNLALLLQATDRLTEAEPLMRRMMLIFLKFTKITGHQHPNLKQAFINYRALLEEMKLTKVQIAERINTLGTEAGFAEQEFQQLLVSLQKSQ